jgi:hypothetical protein
MIVKRFMRYLILLPLLICCPPAIAKQTNAPYSLLVSLATRDSKKVPEHTAFIWPWVKSPGAHSFTNGMTVADLVAVAGGLTNDERAKNMPEIYRPLTVSVMRPSVTNPNPVTFIYHFSLDWSKKDGGISACDFKLQEKDFVSVSMSKVFP